MKLRMVKASCACSHFNLAIVKPLIDMKTSALVWSLYSLFL